MVEAAQADNAARDRDSEALLSHQIEAFCNELRRTGRIRIAAKVVGVDLPAPQVAEPKAYLAPADMSLAQRRLARHFLHELKKLGEDGL